jgi:2'-5' RNA ligase
MRVFVALVPPPEVLDHLEDALAPRRDAGPELRWTDPHQWHVTLAFMAAVPERAVEPLVTRVAEAVADVGAPRLALRSAGTFPDPSAARVLWAGVAGDDLVPLARRVRSAAGRAGAAPDGGPLHPHVTLARFPRATEATRWVRALEPYAGPEWTADEVTLIASHLGEGRGRRPRYEELATAPLRLP